MIFSVQDFNGLKLLLKVIKIIPKMKFVMLFSLASVGFCLGLFVLFLELQYRTYGVHLFDHETFLELFKFDFWDHLGNFLLTFGMICLINLVSIVFKFVLSYLTTVQFKRKKPTFTQFGLVLRRIYHELVRFALINTLGTLKDIIGYLGLSKLFEDLQHMIAGKIDGPYDEYSSPFYMLAIPLIADEGLDTLAAFRRSEKLLHETFGEETIPNFSLRGIVIALTVSIFAIVGGVCFVVLEWHFFPTLILCLTIVLAVASILRNVTIIVDSAVYNFCKKVPTGPFTQKDIKGLFVSKEL